MIGLYVKRQRALADNEWMVELHPTSATRRKDPDLPEIITARLLRYQWPGFRPSWLLTSLLDVLAHPFGELVDLYHRRWQIETIYREWKHGLDIQNLRSHTPSGVHKEVYAHLLLSNLVRWVMTDAAGVLDIHPVDLSYVASLTHASANDRDVPIRGGWTGPETAETARSNNPPSSQTLSLGPLGVSSPRAGDPGSGRPPASWRSWLGFVLDPSFFIFPQALAPHAEPVLSPQSIVVRTRYRQPRGET